MKTVIGWTDSFTSPYKPVQFTAERKEALIHRIKKRRYNFNFSDHQFLAYCAPFYDDGVICVLTSNQWNDVMDSVYKDEPRGQRLMPIDVIERSPINDVLYEKIKWEPKVGESNG